MNLKVEKMRYHKNLISYYLALLSIVFNSIYMVNILRSLKIVPDIHIGIDIVINILFMLFVFLGSEKAKVYSRTWGINLVIIGIISFLRIFYIPYRLFYAVKSAGNSAITEGNFYYLCVFLSLTGICLLISGIIAIIKSNKLHHFLSSLSKNQ